MSRVVTTTVAAAAAAGMLLALVAVPSTSARESDRHAVERVLIFSMPALTWEDVEEAQPPALIGLLRKGAAASMSIRTLGPRTSAGEAYATIGAGNRAGVDDLLAGLAFDRDATYLEGPVTDVYERRVGVAANGAVLHLGISRIADLNEGYLFGAQPGGLGAALQSAGRSAAVIANADGTISGETPLHREAALAVIDDHGRVAGGTVERDLLVEDPRFPFGLRLDPRSVNAAFDEAWKAHDVVLIEAGDLARLERYRRVSTARGQHQARRLAIEGADRLLAQALEAVDLDRHLVMVVAPTSRITGSELTVAVIAGPGYEPGQARSSTTRRDGYVTLTDIAPTVLDAFDIDVPSGMTGGLIRSAGGGVPGPAFIDERVRANELALFRDRMVVPISVLFIVLQGVTYALAAVVLAAGTNRVRPWVHAAALVTLAVPPLAYLSGLVSYDRLGFAGYIAVFVASMFALAALAAGLEHLLAHRAGRARPLVAPLSLVVLTFAVIFVDVLTGAELQINTPFGYSPIVAGRFAGFGNQAFALFAVTAVVGATGIWAVKRLVSGRNPGMRAVLLVSAFFGVVVIVDGHPTLGSDVGGVLALVPAAVLVVFVLAGYRVTWQRLLLSAAGAVAAVTAFALVDLARSADARTHLGRFVASSADDADTIGTVLERKANANISILVSSIWSWVIPIALVFLAFLTWRRAGFLRPLLERVPAIRACLVGSLVAGTLGFLLNDSGVAVPTMMLAVLLPFIATLVMRVDEFSSDR